MQSNLVQRVLALPADSEKRRRILKLFGSFSMATVLLRLDRESPENQRAYEEQIEAILSDLSIG